MSHYIAPNQITPNDEPILEDDYPVFASYWYVADGKPIRSPVQGSVADLKRAIGAKEINRCAAVKRGLI